MKVTMDYQTVLDSAEEELLRMQRQLKLSAPTILKRSGIILKQAVENILPKSERKGSDHVPRHPEIPYVHAKDDVRYKVKKNKKTGQPYVSVGGGKWTGYKWQWLDDGWTRPDGRFIRGLNFIQKAFNNSKDDIETVVDAAIERDIL